jgi:SAM-dependent methyltransferase
VALSQSNVSHHLKILKDLSLIHYNRIGNQKYYEAIENPAIPPSTQALWIEIENMAKELPEIADDERRLLSILRNRTNENIDQLFEAWRKVQPDLPYTGEFALGGIQAKGVAIDVGCGNGELISFLSNSFEKIIGIDLVFEQLQKSGNNFIVQGISEKTLLLKADATQIPLHEYSVDTAYFRMSLRFLPDAALALKEVMRILKSKGRISIIDINPAMNDGSQLTHDYFRKICSTLHSMHIISYNTYPDIFIAILEKD